jgi:hypothetical protein
MKLAILIIILGGFFGFFKEHEEEMEFEYEAPVRKTKIKALPEHKEMLALPPKRPLELPPHADL